MRIDNQNRIAIWVAVVIVGCAAIFIVSEIQKHRAELLRADRERFEQIGEETRKLDMERFRDRMKYGDY